jgi:O-methyltransferase involved in polyketide biosynthesis
MPCRDFYDDHPEAYFKDIKEPALKKQISFAESALCQTLAALQRAHNGLNGQGDIYDRIDFEAAGITKAELVKWHKEHKALDAKHRAAEKAKQNKEALKKAALAKLTAAERNALGVK